MKVAGSPLTVREALRQVKALVADCERICDAVCNDVRFPVAAGIDLGAALGYLQKARTDLADRRSVAGKGLRREGREGRAGRSGRTGGNTTP